MNFLQNFFQMYPLLSRFFLLLHSFRLFMGILLQENEASKLHYVPGYESE